MIETKERRGYQLPPSHLIAVNEMPLALAAVRAGAGLGYLLEHDVAEDIAADRLVQVLDAWCPAFPGYHLYHPSRRQTPPAPRALIDALKTN
ncbi:LysR substrate-binding domain-containing protein [Luteimonas sp. RD2P54]|uniref:LysR substrate-binding domain-containing protein n=1 Tax=Luteimonas endophytica TaxID=3042023 RepID=A0ABT6JDR0_9GAMM|nr:LysR substrate-binding domain-containing protein [Luteimonas endophytica]MDH5824952.1 LysR substrate-binding domain-containing protein [Luteimonas endophytica]